MAILIVLPAERDALIDLHANDERVFNYLCERTDYQTGLIGIKSSVSYPRMALELSEDIPRKALAKQIKLTRKDAMNSVNRLIKAELLSRYKKGNKHLQLTRTHWRKLFNPEHCVETPDNMYLYLCPDFILHYKKGDSA